MALSHLQLTRKAAGSVIMSLKYFMAKKKASILDFQATGKHEFDIPEYINTKQISLISRNNLEMLVSYRTVND